MNAVTPSSLCDAAEKAAPGHALDLLLAAVKVCAGRRQAAASIRVYSGLTPSDVINAVCRVTGCTEKAIMGPTKDAMRSRARQVAWLVTYDHVEGMTLAELERIYGRHPKSIVLGIARAREKHGSVVHKVELMLGLHQAEAAE